MSAIEVRPFQRSDREQLTALVNAHVAAVIPGITVSVNTVMSQLEREPSEAILDPWVVERRTLVAVCDQAVTAGALLHRFDGDERVGSDYRNAGEIRWCIQAYGADAAGDAIVGACLATMDAWQVDRQHASGELPALATYGVPECWPHIRALYLRHGFVHRGEVELILVASLDDLPSAFAPPLPGLTLRRSMGVFGARFSAVLADTVVGYIDIDVLTGGDARSRQLGWSDIGNLWVTDERRRQGIGTWLLGAGADWLRLGGIQRLLTYVRPEDADEREFAAHCGFRELVRTERGWIREP